MSWGNGERRLYRLFLRLLPVGFRRRWEADMEAVFQHRLWETGGRPGRRVWVWVRGISDIAVQAAAEWRTRIQRRDGQRQRGGRAPLAQDARHAYRVLLASPVFTLLAVGILALGIGVSTAGYSIVNSVLFHALPYWQPDRLVVTWPERNHNKAMIQLSEGAIPALESVSGIALWTFTLTGQGEPLEISGAAVSAHHFQVLGVQPALGRAFLSSEGRPGQGGAVVLSYDFWQTVFGGDVEVLGTAIDLSGHGYDQRVIVGVMPRGFRPVFGAPQLWVPLEVDPALPFEADDSWYVNRRVARLAPEGTLPQANQQMRAFARRLREQAPDLIRPEHAETATVVPLRRFVVRGFERILWVVVGTVTLVLFVASANVASLLVVRGEARMDELAIRVALGAGRRQIRLMLLVESGILALAGGLLGILLSIGLIRSFVIAAPLAFPRSGEVRVDGVVLVFALGATLTCTLMGGLLPSIKSGRAEAAGVLARGRRSASGRPTSRLGRALVGLQVALAAFVAVGSGLMLRSLKELLEVEPGLNPAGVLTLRPNPPGDRFPDALRTVTYYESVLTRLRGLPQVESVGAINLLPGTRGTWNFPTFPEGVQQVPGTPPPSINFRAILPGYFETVQIPLIRGRVLEPSDREDGEKVVVVNQAFTDLFWPGEEAIGKHLRIFEPDARPYRIVGVVGNVRQHDRAEPPKPEMYFSAHQYARVTLWVMVRFGDGLPLKHAESVRTAVWSVDENVPLARIQEFSAVMESSTETTGALALLLSVFGGITLVMGAVSIFGLTAHSARRRRAEYGVRLALGASRWDLLRTSVTRCLAPALVGTVVGLSVALTSSGLMGSLIFGVSPSDPVTIVFVALVMLLTATLASVIPAWGACNLDPVRVLNRE